MATLLGQPISYPTAYDPAILEGIDRALGRQDLHLPAGMTGFDRWMCYELSWLSDADLPQCGVMCMDVPAGTPRIVESKSLKLYLNSLYRSCFATKEDVLACIGRDLAPILGGTPLLKLYGPQQWVSELNPAEPQGYCLDCARAQSLPADAGDEFEYRVWTNQFRSLCPVTGQPDWATFEVCWQGVPVDLQWIAQYLWSYREHAGFHEQCVEAIFSHLLETMGPSSLMVRASFTRRGGIDISPCRAFGREAEPAPRRYRQ